MIKYGNGDNQVPFKDFVILEIGNVGVFSCPQPLSHMHCNLDFIRILSRCGDFFLLFVSSWHPSTNSGLPSSLNTAGKPPE